jgi:hypothetical protein
MPRFAFLIIAEMEAFQTGHQTNDHRTKFLAIRSMGWGLEKCHSYGDGSGILRTGLCMELFS